MERLALAHSYLQKIFLSIWPGSSELQQQRESPSSDFGFYPGYNHLPSVLEPANLHPVIRDFQALIENDPVIFMGFLQMFEQVPNTTRYEKDVAGVGPQIRSYEHMLHRFNQILKWAPAFGDGGEFFAFPFDSILNWPMCTMAGYRMFTNDKVNAHIKRILNTWAEFLSSPESRYTLVKDEGGWFGPRASEAMPNFAETFTCNPDEEYFGYKSWDDFFTRKFRHGMRPVDAPEDCNVVTNACESTPYNIAYGVKERELFWIKGEPYSLRHMLNNDPLTPHFIGGTVFQSYLSHLEYHRWHSPVDGTIVKIVSVPGTYFSISAVLGFEYSAEPDPSASGYSQGYMASVATRMIIFIQADSPTIGLMVFLAVGMVEVSSCEATVKEGERVKKGDELGMFHFGGSTYCVVFRPETKIEFSAEVHKRLRHSTGEPGTSTPLLLNRCIGVVHS